MRNLVGISIGLLLCVHPCLMAQSSEPPRQPDSQQTRTTTRLLSGTILSQQNESVAGATVIARSTAGEEQTTTDEDGRFRLTVPDDNFLLRIAGRNINPLEAQFNPQDKTENLQIKVEIIVPPIHENVVIVAAQLDPAIERRNDAVYKDTLFGRDDQLLFTLNGGINAGQHEGGGKSLEVRRFGFNLDHGGVNGGLKILVDDVQQNQATQGHGQGYLGSLKSVTPELVQDVDIINGPFSAQCGDFSSLGVVHIRLRESLPNKLTLRVAGCG